MKINVKILRGEECTLDVQPDLSVTDLKKLVEDTLKVPAKQQKLLITGKPLLDSKKLSDYDLKDGAKLNLIVAGKDNSSPNCSNSSNKDVLKQEMGRFLLQYYNESDSKKILEEFMKEFHRTTSACNLDDWERIATGYLQEEKKNA